MMHDHDLSSLFAAERAVRAPSGAVDQGLSRLLTAVAAQAAPLPVASGTLKLTWTAVSKWILAGFVVGVVGSGALAQVWAPPPQRPAASLTTPNVASVSATRPPIASVAPASEPPPNAPAAPTVRSAPRPSAPPASSEPSRFDAELRLLTLAKTELDAGRPHLAKVWLAEHAERFPNGVFSSDREALRVLAACAERRDPGLARSFKLQHPGSPMVERLLHACEATAAPGIDK